MKVNTFQRPSGWVNKFRNAFRGLARGVLGQSSFLVHIPMSIAVLAMAFWLRVGLIELLILSLCISMVLVAELFNSSLELLAREITVEFNDHIRRALDIASGAVLLTSIVAALIGVAILLPPFWQAIFSG